MENKQKGADFMTEVFSIQSLYLLQENREKIYSNPEKNVIIYKDEQYKGYMYYSDGSYRAYYLQKGIDNIARFINANDKFKLICNSKDYAIISTVNNFLDKTTLSKRCLEELKSILIPYQRKGYSSFTYLNNDGDEVIYKSIEK